MSDSNKSSPQKSKETLERSSEINRFEVKLPRVEDLGLKKFLDILITQGDLEISSQSSFNKFCKTIIRCWHDVGPVSRYSTPSLKQKMSKIGAHNPVVPHAPKSGSIPTSWGGVLIDYIDSGSKPQAWDGLYVGQLVKKWLVVQDGGYLALERHSVKEEKLIVQEGAGLILFEDAENPHILNSAFLIPDNCPDGKSEIVLNPLSDRKFGPWHCVIGFGLVLYEISQDHLGMDQDLIFKYLPD